MADITDRVLARYKQADDHNPDPLTFKAFLSEFKRGFETGREKATSSMMGDAPVPAMNELVYVEEKIAGAAKDLMELARRIEAIASRGSLGVNEHRLSAKVSGILSTLFYQAGMAKGLKGP